MIIATFGLVKLQDSRHYLNLSFLVAVLISAYIFLHFNGTGLEADSFNHYLFAKYALIHPHLLLDHWAKPLFTLLAMPFAQLGFNGIKFFNILLALITTLFTALFLKREYCSSYFLSPLVYFLLPLNYLVVFSGLTEPLCALLLMSSIYLVQKRHFSLAAVIIGFTPFVRSEGLILILAFAFFYSINRRFKAMIYLLAGHLVYSIVGFFYYQNILWVWTELPYANLVSPYGTGPWWHFLDQFIYITGVPGLILFGLGFISLNYNLIKSQHWQSSSMLLVVLCFLSFFLAHSIFWSTGWFNSMGLKRVFGAVMPLISIIIINGIELIWKKPWPKKIRNGLIIPTMIYFIVFLFTSNPASINWEKEMNLSPPQIAADSIGKLIKQKKLDPPMYVYSDPYLSRSLTIDPFGPKRQLFGTDLLANLPDGSIVIWDNWHAVTDEGVQLEAIEKEGDFVLLSSVEFNQYKNKVQYLAFQKNVTKR